MITERCKCGGIQHWISGIKFVNVGVAGWQTIIQRGRARWRCAEVLADSVAISVEDSGTRRT